MAIKCTCNTFNEDGALFCRNCGTKLVKQEMTAGTTSGTKTTATSTSSDTPDWVKVILTVLCIGICIAIACASVGIATPVVAVAGWKGIQAIWND